MAVTYQYTEYLHYYSKHFTKEWGLITLLEFFPNNHGVINNILSFALPLLCLPQQKKTK